jgi:two-component system response regulator YesN
MFKVVLVEDEIVVRESIKKNVDWEANGFTFAGEAPDGELAYALIKETRPDLIISDIKMPFMDGLELSRLIRSEMPEVKIIILTGYDDFEYAQQALRLGVSEYILKPVTEATISSTLARFRKIIEDDRDQLAFLRKYKNDMAEMEVLRRKRFFENWMENKTQLNELLEKAVDLSLPLSAKSYNIILYYLYTENDTEPLSEKVNAVQKKVAVVLKGDKRTLLFDRGIDGCVILVKGDDNQCAADISKELANYLSDVFYADDIHYYIAIGKQTERLGGVPSSFRAANKAYAWRFLADSDKVVYAESSIRPYWHPDNRSQISTLDISKIDKTMTERFLKSGDKAQVLPLVKELFNNIDYAGIESDLLRQYLVMDIYIAAGSFLKELGIDNQVFIQRCGRLDQAIRALESLDGTKEYLVNMLRQCVSLRNEVSQKRYDAMLRQAKDYILKNYNDENISLNAVAATVNVSPTYFSAIFSQSMNITFIEYLTSVRMEKAKEMLCCTSLKTSEIAYKVGYNDPHYFSHLFKKLNDLTPRDFRAKGRVGA